ncbi:hypothetical protein ASPZODRAFT_135807 [Penicilliopsis zonata CBS 506.65]|uniref:F-box domain-containing protein n=1 Tax=Penicilliopsis zonata CBS 506.65 TaxID=1073090 RepID=A0A1L9S9D6_9EURO|nr:hypothetical protein ASPZODRAFT_135807 [Penicilliopsis zonata CBS 506.65]OJJ43781.1 hypothetical protein ASPZODRAFT_135807 [Penicilliopsis zonata CBS 506.65]
MTRKPCGKLPLPLLDLCHALSQQEQHRCLLIYAYASAYLWPLPWKQEFWCLGAVISFDKHLSTYLRTTATLSSPWEKSTLRSPFNNIGQGTDFSSEMPFYSLRIAEKLKVWKQMEMLLRSRTRTQKENKNERCYLLELPTELLLEIISHLSIVPEACLALTCKRFFAISGEILDSKSLHFTRDFAPLFHHYRNGHNFATPRWQFITLLEDSKWRACSSCLKLHPKTAFSAKDLRRKTDTRTCNLGERAGIVDLCPCKKLTFKDKTDMVEMLKVRRSTVEVLENQFSGGKAERLCWHSCSEMYGSTELNVKIYPELDPNDHLIVRTEYQLSTQGGQLGKEENITPRFGCAHRSMDLWLSSVCQSNFCHIDDSTCTSCKRISSCSSCNTVLKCPKKQPYIHEDGGRETYTFWTERSLGGASLVPDKDWAAQRIHPAEPSVNLENCNELCPWTIREHPPPSWPPALDMDILEPAINDRSMSQLYSSIRMI